MAIKRRKRHVGRNIALLLALLASLLVIYARLLIKEEGEVSFITRAIVFFQKTPNPSYGIGDHVLVIGKSEVGRVESISMIVDDGQKKNQYQVAFSSTNIQEILEDDLSQVDVPFEIGQTTALINGSYLGDSSDGQIETIRLAETGDFIFSASFPILGIVDELTRDDLIWISSPALSEDNTGLENQQSIQKAISKAKSYSYSRLVFPEGRYLIGSEKPETDYLLLESNLELIGNNTTLLVDGAAYWFGLTTGTAATDGLSNFVMKDLAFEAKDLKQGAEFKLMANHGYNWQIWNNRFTLVHKMSSHVFDLGGVQYARFDANIFEGYAPNLTGETEIGDRDLHNFYSEAIQLDASSNNGVWDGGLLQKIDSHYDVNNQETHLTSQVTMTNNSFIPYYNNQSEIVAYGATIGQHSSEVGEVSIYNNYFKGTLASRFIDQVDSTNKIIMKPIHFAESTYDYSDVNVIE